MRSFVATLVLAACHSTAPTSPPPIGEAPTAGTYTVANGRLVVKAIDADSFTFDLTFVMPSEGAHHGDIADGTARRDSAGHYRYTSGPDCVIGFTPRPAGAVEVAQKGTCDSAGFGAFVDVSGTYAAGTAVPAATPIEPAPPPVAATAPPPVAATTAPPLQGEPTPPGQPPPKGPDAATSALSKGLKACYMKALAADPATPGGAKIEIDIDAKGNAIAARVCGAKGDLKKCLKRVALEAKLDPGPPQTVGKGTCPKE